MHHHAFRGGFISCGRTPSLQLRCKVGHCGSNGLIKEIQGGCMWETGCRWEGLMKPKTHCIISFDIIRYCSGQISHFPCWESVNTYKTAESCWIFADVCPSDSGLTLFLRIRYCRYIARQSGIWHQCYNSQLRKNNSTWCLIKAWQEFLFLSLHANQLIALGHFVSALQFFKMLHAMNFHALHILPLACHFSQQWFRTMVDRRVTTC